jgi:penicillin-binding protein 2
LGYIAEISEEEKKRFPNREAGDIVGKSGIERAYEDLLAGRKGYHYLIVNAVGQITGELVDKYIPPQRNGNLYLTIDLELQILAEELLEGKRGAAVALDPNNGEILAIASTPKYDPEVFTGVLRSEDWQQLQTDPDVPLLHRAIQSGYPPASTFKMVTLTAALEEGFITEDYEDNCTGSYKFGRIYHCFKSDGHGKLTPVQAIEQSCDSFFYRLGHALGVDKLGHYMRIYRFGSLTGIDLENETEGIAPDSAYLDRRYGAGEWSPGLALNIAIGQGEILATPLQLAHYCGILATGGLKAVPHLFLEMHLEDEESIQFQRRVSQVDLKPETFELLRNGMRRVIGGEDGTAKWLEDPNWHMAGKTGTAQNPHGEDHALFIGFAPFENPVIAVAVVVENVGFGSTHAAPIAIKLMRRYLKIMQIPESVQEEDLAILSGHADGNF